MADKKRYNIAPIHSNYQVHYALASPWARDPEYVRGIVRSYVENKRLRGKTSMEVGQKLNLLEKELPSFLQAFCDVREQYSLPPSPWVRRPRMDYANGGSGPSRRVSSATTSRYNIANPSMSYFDPPGSSSRLSTGVSTSGSPLTRTTTAPGRQQSADRRTNRLSGAGTVDDSALPAEFRVRRQNTEDTDEPPPPPYARQDPEPDSTMLLAQRLAAEQGNNMPQDTPPPAVTSPVAPPTPPRRTPSRPTPSHNQNSPQMSGSYAAPASPPPSARPASSSPATRSERPDLPRSDSEQLRLAYEESQLEEAKRESMAAEREREEMERAIQMSLEAEKTDERVRRESGNGQWSAGPGSAGPSHVPTGPQPPPQQSSSQNGAAFDPFANVDQLGGQMQNTSLLDDDDNFLAIPPMHTGQSSNVNTPSARLQSKNPFLSPHDSAKPLPRPPSQTLSATATGASGSRSASDRLVYQVPYTTGPNGTPPGQTLPPSPGHQTGRPSASQQTQDGGRAVVIVDDGAHVTEFDKAQQIIQGLITQAKLDVYFVNSKRVGKDIETTEDVQDLFGGLSPRGNASLGARLDYLLHESNIIVITDGACAHPVAKRAKQLRINPSLTSEQLLSGEPPDDLEKVLETRVGRVHFVQIGNDEEGHKGLEALAAKGMSMEVFTSLSEEFVQSTLGP